MASPSTIVEVVGRTLSRSPEVPDSVSYILEEADSSGSDADVSLPIVEIQIVSSIDIDEFNTDQVDVLTDDQGNEIGRRFHTNFELDLQIDIWVAEGSRHDVDRIGRGVRRALYEHDTAGPGRTMNADIDDDGSLELFDSIWRFKVDDGERRDDLSMTPSVRRWRQDAMAWSYEVFDTTDEYIAAVNYPGDGDFEDSDADGQITD